MDKDLLILDYEKRGYSVEITKGLKARLSCKHCSSEIRIEKLYIPNMFCYRSDKYLELTDKILQIVGWSISGKKKILSKKEEQLIVSLKAKRTKERLKQIEIFNQDYLQISEKMPWPTDFSESEASYKCDLCISKRGSFKSEHSVRLAFMEIFKAKFPRLRPNWLRKSTGRSLELDGFNEKLKIAFEHNGDQHYKYIPRFHQSEKDLNEIKKRDALKVKACANMGVKLYVIPQAPSSGVLEYVKKCIEEQS